MDKIIQIIAIHFLKSLPRAIRWIVTYMDIRVKNIKAFGFLPSRIMPANGHESYLKRIWIISFLKNVDSMNYIYG